MQITLDDNTSVMINRAKITYVQLGISLDASHLPIITINLLNELNRTLKVRYNNKIQNKLNII